jgi:hypothetical protein
VTSEFAEVIQSIESPEWNPPNAACVGEQKMKTLYIYNYIYNYIYLSDPMVWGSMLGFKEVNEWNMSS